MKVDDASAALLYELATHLLKDDPALKMKMQHVILMHLALNGHVERAAALLGVQPDDPALARLKAQPLC